MDRRAVASFMALAVVIIAAPVFAATSHRMKEAKGKKIPAVFAYGDSIMDTGNNNVLPTMSRCNFPPYGMDFADRKATGRFSNGKVPADLIASALRIKELLPPYLTTTKSEELLTGVSFASGGTGFDPMTASVAGSLSMPDQSNMLLEYKARLASIAGQDKADRIISNGLHVVCGGSNDLISTFTASPIRNAQYNISSYTSVLANSASQFVQELYQLGARRIGAIGLPPLGCVPSQRTLAGAIRGNCSYAYNQAATLFNGKLLTEVNRLSRSFQDARIVYMDIFTPLSDIIQRPSAYGFLESSRGCCGTGLFERAMLCNSVSASTCSNVTQYVFWDSVHPTQKVYEIVVSRMMHKYLPLFM